MFIDQILKDKEGIKILFTGNAFKIAHQSVEVDYGVLVINCLLAMVTVIVVKFSLLIFLVTNFNQILVLHNHDEEGIRIELARKTNQLMFKHVSLIGV